MIPNVDKYIGLRCTICGRKFKKYSKWVENHFAKHHPEAKVMKLERLYDKW